MTEGTAEAARPLARIRVIDLSNGVAGAYGARLLAGLGADVIKVEAPEGDPTWYREPRIGDSPQGSVLYAYLNAGKRSIIVDPSEPGGIERIRSLVVSANAVVESGAPGQWAARGLDLESLRQEHPGLVVCSVSPYGQDGPRSGWKVTALTAFATGGQMMLCGDEDKPPLKTAGFQAEYQAGLHVFASTMMALAAVELGRRGDRIDISMQEVQAACLEGFGPAALTRGSDASRTGNQLRATWGMYPCADGWVGVAAMARQTAAVYECIGRPELSEDPAFVNLLMNPEMNDVVNAFIGEWTGERTVAEIFGRAGECRAPFSMVATPEALLENAQLEHEGFWQETDHPVLGHYRQPGMPFTIDGVLPPVSRPPVPGEHTAEIEAESRIARTANVADDVPLLEGIRVLDLSQVWAGPYASRFLADMGADVIHIEGPDFADAVRGVGRSEEPRGFDMSAYFNEYNRNKRGMALALDRPEGREAFLKMVAKADIVLENWSVGVADRLGLEYASLSAANPKIVFVQMPAYGQTGPEAARVGFGPAIEQMGGLVALQGYEGEGPHRSGISYGDPNAGTVAAGACALGILRRERAGVGSHIVMRQRDNLIGMVGEYMVAASLGMEMPRQIGNRDPQMAPHGVYRCRDDEARYVADIAGNIVRELNDTWVAIAVDSDQAWRGLKSVVAAPRLEDPSLATLEGRKASEQVIDAAIEAWTCGRNAEEAAAELQRAGVSAAPVLSPLMVTRDGHLNERGFFPTYDHPVAGVHRTTRPVWRLAERPLGTVRPAPCFGEHNREVLRELAVYSEAEIDALEAAGVIADTPVA